MTCHQTSRLLIQLFSAGVLASFFTSCNAVEFGELIVNDDVTARKWIQASSEFDSLIFPQKKLFIDTLDIIYHNKSQLSLSDDCADSFYSISKGLKDKQMWAYQFMDATARGKSGFTYGYISDFGNFDQCLLLRAKKEQSVNGKEFGGKYCMVNVKFPLTQQPERNFLRPMKLNLSNTGLTGSVYEFYANHTEMFFYDTFSFGVCIPSSCSRQEFQSILDRVFDEYQLEIETRKSCEEKRTYFQIFMSKPWDVKFSLIVISILAGIVFVSTVLNYFCPNLPYISYFCAMRNSRKLTADYTDPSMIKLRFFDTFKCFFQLGGTLAHIVCFMPAVPVMFAVIQDRDNDMQDLWLLSQLFQKAIYYTQVILVISGFFTSYYMLPVLDKTRGKLNFIPFVVKRWLRTAPTLAGGILCMFALSGIIYGPLADEINDKYLNTCRKTWWLTILNINNFHRTYDVCLPQTWTQSADFHLWILSYFPLIWLYKNPKKGIKACLTIIVAGTIIPAIITYLKDLPSPVGIARPLEIMFLIVYGNNFPTMAYHTYNNMSNYFLGLLLGYFCYRGITFSHTKVIAMNIFSWILIVLCFIGPYIWIHQMGNTFSNLANAAYAGIFKVSYGLLYSCCIYNVFVYDHLFSKWLPGYWMVHTKFFSMWGKLALSIYVSQLAPIGYYMAMSYDPFPVNWYTLVLRVISIISQIYILGYIVFLLFEAPFLNFGKSLTFKSNEERVENQTETTNNDKKSN